MIRNACIVVAALLSGALAAAPAQAERAEASTLTVAVVSPQRHDWPQTVPASGWLRPWHEAVIASEYGGARIVEILVDVGSTVKNGQVLVQLASDAALAELRRQEAAVATAEADLEKAQSNAARARQVKGSGALSDERVSEYLIAEKTAEAALKSAWAALDSQKIKVEQTAIRAVDDGLITARSAQLGAVVSAGSELFRLQRQQRVEWQAEISARYLPQIRSGMRATISGPGGKKTVGEVRLLAPVVNTDTGRAILYVALPQDSGLVAGLFATGEIDLEPASALTVPETALVLRDGINYLFVVGERSRANRVRVETGRRRNSEVEITSGLEPDAKVVKAGGAFLSPGAAVRVEVATR